MYARGHRYHEVLAFPFGPFFAASSFLLTSTRRFAERRRKLTICAIASSNSGPEYLGEARGLRVGEVMRMMRMMRMVPAHINQFEANDDKKDRRAHPHQAILKANDDDATTTTTITHTSSLTRPRQGRVGDRQSPPPNPPPART